MSQRTMLKQLIALAGTSLIAVLMCSTAQVASAQEAPFQDLTWSFGASIPNKHKESASAEVNNTILVISGADISCSDAQMGTVTTAVDIYDTVQDAFTSGPAVNLARNQYPMAATVGNGVFLIGGTASCFGPTVRPVERLDVSTNTWTVLPSTSDLPLSLDGAWHCGTAHANQIYYFQSAGIGVFDTTTETWTVLSPPSPLLTPSLFCRATTVGDQIVITGPGDGSPGTNS